MCNDVNSNEGENQNKVGMMKGVSYHPFGLSVFCSTYIMTDGVIVECEHLLLVSVQLNHGSTLLSVSLQDAAHLQDNICIMILQQKCTTSHMDKKQTMKDDYRSEKMYGKQIHIK